MADILMVAMAVGCAVWSVVGILAEKNEKAWVDGEKEV